eukprot:3699772-Prymnesium_polylepis.1
MHRAPRLTFAPACPPRTRRSRKASRRGSRPNATRPRTLASSHRHAGPHAHAHPRPCHTRSPPALPWLAIAHAPRVAPHLRACLPTAHPCEPRGLIHTPLRRGLARWRHPRPCAQPFA